MSAATSPPAATAELRAALTALLGGPGGARRIRRLRHRPSPYLSSLAVEEIDVHFEAGAPLRLVLKDLSPPAMPALARQARPPFLVDPLREIETYRDLLAGASLGTPAYHGASVDPEVGRYWLFLERVPGWNLWQVGELAVWHEAARWLAALHGRFAPEVGRLAAARRLLRYDRAFYGRWLERARSFAAERVGRFAGDDARDLARLWRGYERAIDRLASLPVTLVHGEFYPSNVIVQARPAGVRVCPVDWEMAAVAPGLIDLAALTAGKWSESERRGLAESYRAALALGAGEPLPDDQFWLALDCCRLHVAVQWLGWSSEWSPPAQHAHDWLSEALALAEQVGP